MERRWVSALIVALGLLVAGGAIGGGSQRFRTGDRYVTVKGVAERDVAADVALGPLKFVAPDNDLAQAQSRMERTSSGSARSWRGMASIRTR